MDVGGRVDGRLHLIPVALHPLGHVVLGDGQHAARTAARVVDRGDDAGLGQPCFVTGQQQIDHQVDHIARREMLARVFVERFIELADQLFEDGAHGGIVDHDRDVGPRS